MVRKNTIWADENDLAKDISGKVYIVTGSNSGVGLETARQLVKQGGHVVMAVRRPEAGEKVAKAFDALKGSYEVMRCDLADLQSVRGFVDAFESRYNRLDGLMCNAGAVIMGDTAQYSKDGFELTMAASFYGHFLMTELLLDTIKATQGARIGILSSVVHAGNPKNRYAINFDDIDWKTRKYSAFTAYGEAKLAVVLYAKELAERLKGSDVTVNSIHPGWARSNFGSGGGLITRALMAIARPLTRSMSDSNWASAQTSLHILLNEDVPNHNGAYYSQSSVLYRDPGTKDGGWPMTSPNPHAHDMDMARKLVALARRKTGLG